MESDKENWLRVVLLLVLCGVLILSSVNFSWFTAFRDQVQTLEQEKTAADAAVRVEAEDMQRAITRANEETDRRLTGIESRLNAIESKQAGQENAATEQQKALDRRVSQIQALLLSQNNKLSTIARKLQYEMDTLKEESLPPLPAQPFAYYTTDVWKQRVTEAMKEANAVGARAGLFDGGTGNDTLKFGGGDLRFNGVRFRSLEIILLANGNKNNIGIYAPGLSDLEEGSMRIDADPEVDTVTLDGCLTWKKGKADKNYTPWTATDTAGVTRTLLVSNKVPVTKEASCDARYLRTEKQAWLMQISAEKELNEFDKKGIEYMYPDRSQPQGFASDERAELREAARVTEEMKRYRPMGGGSGDLETPAQPYTPDDAANIKIYRQQLAGVKDARPSSVLESLPRLMEQGKLPTVFPLASRILADPQSAYMGRLRFDASAAQSYLNPASCKGHTVSSDVDGSVIIVADQPMTLKCMFGQNLYVLGGGKDMIEDTIGDDIFATGAGDDEISAGKGTDIVLLEKGWGRMSLTKKCDQATVTPERLFVKKPSASFGGIGLGFDKTGDQLVISKIPAGKPAARAGLVSGDKIMMIDGKPVSGFSFTEAIHAIRGEPGTTVTLKIQSDRADSVPRDVAIVREVIEVQESSGQSSFSRIDYKWPYEFRNFIIFGQGIGKDDIVWENGWLKNKATGDTLFLDGKCFNFVYSDDTP